MKFREYLEARDKEGHLLDKKLEWGEDVGAPGQMRKHVVGDDAYARAGIRSKWKIAGMKKKMKKMKKKSKKD